MASYLQHENVLKMMVKCIGEDLALKTIPGTTYVGVNQTLVLGVVF